MRNKYLFCLCFVVLLLFAGVPVKSIAQEPQGNIHQVGADVSFCDLKYPLELDAEKLKIKSIQASVELFQDATFQRMLRCVVGEGDYQNITGSAVHHVVPNVAKDGSAWVMIENASRSPLIFVNIFQNGKMYVLLNDHTNSRLKYFTNEKSGAGNLTPLLRAAAHLFPQKSIIFESVDRVDLIDFEELSGKATKEIPQSLSGEPAPDDVKKLRKFAVSVFGEELANGWNYNEAV
jgi:hypothetical protein